jgi:hypothetical protein
MPVHSPSTNRQQSLDFGALVRCIKIKMVALMALSIARGTFLTPQTIEPIFKHFAPFGSLRVKRFNVAELRSVTVDADRGSTSSGVSGTSHLPQPVHERLAGAIGLRRIARQFLVRQVGVVPRSDRSAP